MNRIELPAQSGAYRWYYVDVTAGDYTAVFIFMIGSIFSAKLLHLAEEGRAAARARGGELRALREGRAVRSGCSPSTPR